MPSSSLLDAVIGTKVDLSPGGEMLPHLLPSNNNNNGRQSNSNGGTPHISEIVSTNTIFTTKFVTNLMIVGLLFWSIVFILLCFVIWRSRGRSKKKEYQRKVRSDTRVGQSAISTQVQFENPLSQQNQHPGYHRDVVARNQEQSNVLFPKTEPDDDEKWESFKSRVGLDNGVSSSGSSFKDRYSLTTVDKDLYMHYEEERTADEWRKSVAGDYV